MKKFLKSIFITLCLSLVIISASAFLHINKSNTCYAANDDNMHTVNFYSENELLYSVEIEDGQSLQDLVDSNLIYNLMPNTSFNLATTNDYYGFPLYAPNGNQFIFRGVQKVDYINEISYFDTSSSGISFIRLYDSNSNIIDLTNKRVFFSLYVDDYLNVFDIQLNSYSTSGNVWEGKIRNSNGVINSSRPRIYYNFTTGIWECGLDLWDNVKYKISSIKLQYDEYTPFLNLNYIDTLFKEKNNLSKEANVLWYTINNSGEFDFSQPITEDTNIYGYEELEFNQNAEQLNAEVSYQPSYYLLEKAIDNIEYIHYKGQFKFNVSIDTSKLTQNIQFLTFRSSKKIGNMTPSTTSTTTQTQYFSSMSFSNEGFDDFEYLNFALLSENNSIYVELKSVNLIPTYTFYLVKNTGIINFIFSPSTIALNVIDLETGTTKAIDYFGEVENYIFYDGTEINDMNSNTNYFLNFDYLTLSSNYYLNFSQLLEKQLTTISMTYNYSDYNNSSKYLSMSLKENNNYTYYNFYQQDLYTFTGSDQFSLIFNGYNSDGIIFLTNAIPDNAYTPLTTESGFTFSQFDIIVRKPVARVDNSLVIFNYGYNNFLNSVTQTRYELRRGINYYDVVYNGQLENSKMIVIDNEYVRNSLFDEYIFVSFIIDGDKTTTYDIKDGKIGTYLGFDFNFVYYTQPLVAGNASYDLMQYRPEYMDGTPSLYPFRLPVTAWIYNAFLWLIFDCPLISDLLGLLHLNSFMGALLNIFDLYVNSGIGQFILACLSFIIFWLILKSLMPSIVGGLKSSISTAYKNYNDNKMEETVLKMNIARQQMRQKGRYKSFKFNKGRLNYHKNNGISRVHQRNLVKRKFTGSVKSTRPKIKDNKV